MQPTLEDAEDRGLSAWAQGSAGLRITRVMVQNYRSIKGCDVELPPVALLVGPNGSGKSNFVDSITLVRDALVNNLETAIRNRGGIDAVRRQSGGHPPNFGIRLDIELPTARAKYAFMVTAGKNFAFTVKREDCEIQREDGTIARFTRHGDRISSTEKELDSARVAPSALLLSLAQATEEFAEVAGALADVGTYSFDPTVVREPQTPDTGDVLAPSGGNLASVIRNLAYQDPARLDRIAQYLGTIVPGVHEVFYKAAGAKETINFKQTVAGAPRPWTFGPESVSDGTIRALCVLVACYQLGASAVAIEEPETAVHPGAAVRLMDAILEAANRRQLILTTHSPDLLDHGLIQPESLLAVESRNGETLIGPVDHATREAVKNGLFTTGQLLRLQQVRSDIFSTPQRPPRLF